MNIENTINFDDAPFYEKIGDHTIIGVKHKDNVFYDFLKYSRFLQEIEGADHLILEGSLHAMDVNLELNPYCYECVAVVKTKCPIYFLEENADFLQLATNYGVPKNLLGLYELFRVIPTAIDISKSVDEFYNNLQTFLEIKSQNSNGWEQVDIRATMNKFQEIMNNHFDIFSFFAGVGNIYGYYLSRIREYELMKPKILELTRNHKGKKIEIVGANHTDFLATVLRGEDVDPVKDWQYFVSELEPDFRDVIRRMEEEIYPIT